MINKDKLYNTAKDYGIELDEKMLGRFDIYAKELVETNSKFNLTAITDEDGIIVKHFIDSLSILKYFDVENGSRIIDVGSGAGFPSLPLLIAKDGDLRVTFLDSVQKKLNFIQTALDACSLDAEVIHVRAEELSRDRKYRESYDIATARAVARLNVLCELCLPFVKVGGHFIALKGSNDETKEAERAISLLGGEIESNVSYKLPNGDERSMVIIKKISQTPTEFPRKYKNINSKPL